MGNSTIKEIVETNKNNPNIDDNNLNYLNNFKEILKKSSKELGGKTDDTIKIEVSKYLERDSKGKEILKKALKSEFKSFIEKFKNGYEYEQGDIYGVELFFYLYGCQEGCQTKVSSLKDRKAYNVMMDNDLMGGQTRAFLQIIADKNNQEFTIKGKTFKPTKSAEQLQTEIFKSNYNGYKDINLEKIFNIEPGIINKPEKPNFIATKNRITLPKNSNLQYSLDGKTYTKVDQSEIVITLTNGQTLSIKKTENGKESDIQTIIFKEIKQDPGTTPIINQDILIEIKEEFKILKNYEDRLKTIGEPKTVEEYAKALEEIKKIELDLSAELGTKEYNNKKDIENIKDKIDLKRNELELKKIELENTKKEAITDLDGFNMKYDETSPENKCEKNGYKALILEGKLYVYGDNKLSIPTKAPTRIEGSKIIFIDEKKVTVKSDKGQLTILSIE